MFYIIGSILCNSALFIILKMFQKYNISTIQGIVFNYFTAAIIGLIVHPVIPSEAVNNSNFWMASIPLGFLFISVFYMISLTAQKVGISAASVSNKMSLVIPVIASIIIYSESSGWMKIVGILLALVSVVLTVHKKEKNENKEASSSRIILPLIVFIGTGVIDALINIAQKSVLKTEDETSFFISTTFIISGFLGLLYVFVLQKDKTEKIQWRNIIAGIVLGIPNYFSIFLIMLVIGEGKIESSVIYPIVNIGVVLSSTLLALLFFKEKLSWINYLGIVVSVIAIVCITYK